MTHIENVGSLDVKTVKSKVTEGIASWFISDAREAEIMNSIYEADRQMRGANDKIDGANDELVKSDEAMADAENQSGDAKTQENDAKSKKDESANGKVSQQQSAGENYSQQATSRTQAIQGAQQDVEQTNANITQNAAAQNSSIDGYGANVESLMAASAAAADEIDNLQNQNNDGTGVGTSSAYSLSTGFEIQQQSENPTQGAGQNNVQSRIAAQMSIIQGNDAQIGALIGQAGAAQQQTIQSIEQGTAQVQQQEAMANEAASEGNQAKNGIQQALDVVDKVHTAADALDVAGSVLNGVGVGLNAAGTVTSVTGGAVTGTGAVLTGVGAGLTALGVPLCAFFGAGAPVVAAGGTTTAGGGTTTATGGTVIGAGQGLIATGQTISTVGKGLSTSAKAIKVATTATSTGLHVAEGNWDKAITSATSFVVMTASTTSSLASLSKATGGKFEKVANFAENHKALLQRTSAIAQSANDVHSVVNDIKDGASAETIAAHGLSALSFATGVSSSDRMANAGDILNGMSYTAAVIDDVKDPNKGISYAIFDATNAIGSYGAAGARSNKDQRIGKILDKGFSTENDVRYVRREISAVQSGSDVDAASNFFMLNGKIQKVYGKWFAPEKPEATRVPIDAPIVDDGGNY